MATLTSENIVERRGSRFRWRYLIGAALLLPILAHLLYSAVNSPLTNYYMTVDELLSRPTAGQVVRVGGTVIPGSPDTDRASGALTFQLAGDTKRLAVTYRGLAPDSFGGDTTAIVEGQLGPDGMFIAESLLIKCPHRYIAL